MRARRGPRAHCRGRPRATRRAPLRSAGGRSSINHPAPGRRGQSAGPCPPPRTHRKPAVYAFRDAGMFVVLPERRCCAMGIGTSLVLIAVGAILAFAVNIHSTIGSTTVHWHTIGWILMIIGVIGLVISAIWMASANRRTGVVRERDYVDDRPAV